MLISTHDFKLSQLYVITTYEQPQWLRASLQYVYLQLQGRSQVSSWGGGGGLENFF